MAAETLGRVEMGLECGSGFVVMKINEKVCAGFKVSRKA